MKLPNIVDTIGFKLSALYLGLFIISFLAISISVYLLTCQILEQQLKSSIEIAVNRLKAEYDAGGISELKDEIDELIGFAAPTKLLYGVIAPNRQLIIGNFSNFELSEGWQTTMQKLPAKQANQGAQQLVYINVIALSNNLWLGVGQHGEAIQNAGKAVIKAFITGFGFVILLGAIGGFFISRAFLNKIQRITSSTGAIIAGDLKHRLPVSKDRDELDKLASLLNLMLDKIVALMENIQQVSNDIAHDLRTPISHLKFRLEDALNRDLPVTLYQERIAFAIEEVDAILATFTAMLRISQIESGCRRSGFNTVDLNQIVTSVTDALHPVAQEQGKTIDTNIGQAVILNGDKELLTQLTFNVLENALLHTPKDTQIKISLYASNNQINFIVADNGPGIAEQDRQQVFRRFYRLEQSRTTPGNGLGLSIVAAIVELHGGTITLADNHPGLKVLIHFYTKKDDALS